MTSENRARNAISKIRKGSYEDWIKVIQYEIDEHAKQCLLQAVERIDHKIDNAKLHTKKYRLTTSQDWIREYLRSDNY